MAAKPAQRPKVPKRSRESATSHAPNTTAAATHPIASEVSPRPILKARPARSSIWRGVSVALAVGVGWEITGCS
jgi:hypothetical protein